MDNTFTPPEPQNLIADALALPLDLKGYHISQALHALFPDSAVIQGEPYAFDLDEFVADGHCTAIPRPDLFQQFIVSYNGSRRRLEDEAANVWYAVEWQGKSLQVVQITWFEGNCTKNHYWVIAETEVIAREFYLRVCEWCSEVRGEVLVFDNGYWHKDQALFHAIRNATFANLILPPHLKQEIQEDFAQFFASRTLYERYRIPWKRGVLLLGPPGNGKTHTVKALLNRLNVPCLYVKSFKHRYQTDQQCIHQVFRRARETTPCILVLEDLDSLLNDKNRSFFLNELDGFAANTGIVVLATTNHPERLDPALINRPSRFDRKYHFELPAEAERAAYIRAWNDAMETELQISDAGITNTVIATEGFSFAYLKELFLSSLMRWIAAPNKTGMEAVLAEQSIVLREQMHAMNEMPPVPTDPDEYEDEE